MNQREYDDLSFNSQWLIMSNRRLLVGGMLWEFARQLCPGHQPVAIPVFPELPATVWVSRPEDAEFTEPMVYYFQPVRVPELALPGPCYEITVRRGKNED